MMMDLRKLSNHPLLLREIYDDEKLKMIAKILAKEKDYKETNVEYIQEDLEVLSDFQIHSLCKSFKVGIEHVICYMLSLFCNYIKILTVLTVFRNCLNTN